MSENVMIVFIDQLSALINNDTTSKADEYVDKYLQKMDADLFTELLEQTKDMLVEIKSLNLRPGSKTFNLIIDEFKIRWFEMNDIVLRARKKRKAPALSDSDKKLRDSIIHLSRNLLGENYSSDGIVRFLIEVKNNE